jgi:hypothetical protein
VIDEVLNLRGDWNFEFVATFWIANKKHVLTNIVTSAVIWCMRYKLCFQGPAWTGEKVVMLWIAGNLRRWKPMYGQELGSMVESVIQKLEDKAYQPPRICWNGGRDQVGRCWILSLRDRKRSRTLPTWCRLIC